MARAKTIHFLLAHDRSERRLVNMERFREGKSGQRRRRGGAPFR
jgi:hypothetical protein